MLPRAATEFYALQQRVNFTAKNEIARLWRSMGDDFDASWRRLAPSILGVLIEAQSEVSRAARDYVPKSLAELNLRDSPSGDFVPNSLVGIASDGRALDSLAYGSVVKAKEAAENGAGIAQALSQGGDWLDLMTKLQVADAARQAVGIMTATRKNMGGTVRVLNPPSCQRCAILAGRWYRWSTGFDRHPRCFPAGTVVSGPASDAATRRWFEGEIVLLSTASGQELSLTGNHPVLTSRGWVAANKVKEGDQVVRSTRPQGATSLVVPNHDEVPARIEDVWGALGVAGLDSMESSPEDFHGDGQRGEVHVVRADRALNRGIFTPSPEELQEFVLSVASGATLALDSECAAILLDLGQAAHPGRLVGLRDLDLPFLLAHSGIAHDAGRTHVSSLHPGLAEHAADSASRYRVLSREGVLTRSGGVFADDALGRDVYPRTRWDAPTLPDPVEQGSGYAELGLDLLERLAGQVELDRVVFSRSADFRGHVYSLTSSEGWHTANSLIVSNCDCTNLPVPSESYASAEGFMSDPMLAYRNGEIRDLTKAQKFAIDNGADIYRVVNATRGMSTTATTRPLSKRAARRYGSGKYDQPIPVVAPGMPDLLAGVRAQLKPTSSTASYPTPEGLYRQAAGDREQAIRLLREWGYID